MNRQGGPWAHRRAGAELALRIDVHPSLLSKVDHGRIEAWPRCRQAAATALGVDEVQLFGDPQR